MDYVDLTLNNLRDICGECVNRGTEQCIMAECNVGFSITVLEYRKESQRLILKDGIQLIPKEDTKFYDEKKVARSIASICKSCKECNERHTESCTISLARKSMEGLFLQDMLPYPGNILSYFVNVGKQNQNFANLIMEEFREMN